MNPASKEKIRKAALARHANAREEKRLCALLDKKVIRAEGLKKDSALRKKLLNAAEEIREQLRLISH